MDFVRPLWVSHYGLCFTSLGHGHKGNNKHSQLLIKVDNDYTTLLREVGTKLQQLTHVPHGGGVQSPYPVSVGVLFLNKGM